VVCEGEFDAAVAWQYGFPAIGRPGGKRWTAEWSELLRDRHVALIYDCDDAGRRYGTQDSAALADVAASIRVVDLGLADGDDITDFFLKYQRTAAELRARIRSARKPR
jgi:DNA primase